MVIVVLAKTKLEIINYEQLLGQFWSDGTADRGSTIPMRLGKYASKTERSRAPVLVGIGTDEDTRSLVVYQFTAIRGKPFNYEKSGKVLLTNKTLFARDRHTCAFCGNHFFEKNLSRDHIHPVSRGGRDVWTNVVTACIPCNLRKGDKYLSQAGMELLYVPYEPNHYENLILLNRNILQDQMDYLLNGVPKHSRVWQ